jgi:hypothetical protein
LRQKSIRRWVSSLDASITSARVNKCAPSQRINWGEYHRQITKQTSAMAVVKSNKFIFHDLLELVLDLPWRVAAVFDFNPPLSLRAFHA